MKESFKGGERKAIGIPHCAAASRNPSPFPYAFRHFGKAGPAQERSTMAFYIAGKG